MPDQTKLTLSEKELSLVKNVDWILTKQLIIEKVSGIISAGIPVISEAFSGKEEIPLEVRSSTPKIFRGENYLQLPYVIMDYPRVFNREDIFAIRTMFWWGNFFSINLQLAGKYKILLKDVMHRIDATNREGIFIGVNENQWQHHFEADNFLPWIDFTVQESATLFDKNDFIKLAIKLSLDDWDQIPYLLDQGYKRLAALIA